MKLLTLFFYVLLLSIQGYTQPLTAEIEIFQEPYCRTSGNQSGRGILLGRTEGGAGNSSYGWYYGSDFTLVGYAPTLNVTGPGEYHLVIKDDAGDSVIASVMVDSIDIVSNFGISSDQFNASLINEVYDSAKVRFANLSEGYRDYNDPNPDISFKWNFDVNNDTSSWFFTYDVNVWPQTTFYPGVHKTCLIAKNFNNCVDTTCKTISVIDSEGEIMIEIVPDYQKNIVSLKTKNIEEGDLFHIYDLRGRLTTEIILKNELQWNQINFNQARGAYLYSIVSDEEIVKSGKFVF